MKRNANMDSKRELKRNYKIERCMPKMMLEFNESKTIILRPVSPGGGTPPRQSREGPGPNILIDPHRACRHVKCVLVKSLRF